MTTTNHPPPDNDTASGKPPGADRAPHWTVLLVDDEPDILSSIQLLLERSRKGLKVVTASSGPEALRRLAEEDFDLLVSDFKMPVMDGIQFLSRARELRPGLPRVMFTAYADADLSRRAFTEAFVVDFIPKTLAPSQLVEKVESLLAEHAGLRGEAGRGPGSDDPSAAAAGEAS